MKDPHKVLGVTPNASDDEIKSAYKALLKKYHPDNYAGTNNPLENLAVEKYEEVIEAYDEIMNMRKNGFGGNYQQTNYNQQNAYNQQYDYNANNYGRQNNNDGCCGGGDDGCCDLCCKLWCADTCCECMGGDLCSCF